MAADTAAKRFSAMNMSVPFRGLNVVPNVAIPAEERQAVMFWYSGISFEFVSGQPFRIRFQGVPTMSRRDRPPGWN